MSLIASIIAVFLVGFFVFLVLSLDRNTNFTFGDLSLFAFFSMLLSLVLIIPLHFVYLNREETRLNCEKSGGVLIEDFQTCVKKDVYESYINKENHIKIK